MTTLTEPIISSTDHTDSPLTHLHLPVRDRRNQLLPDALKITDKIQEGRQAYEAYRQAVTILSVDPKNNEAYKAITLSGLVDHQSSPGYGSITAPENIDNSSENEISHAETLMKNQEVEVSQRLARNFGLFSAAIDAGDTQIAIKLLHENSDFYYQPEIVGRLESLLAQQLVDNPPITRVTRKMGAGDYQISTQPFFTALTQEQDKTNPLVNDLIPAISPRLSQSAEDPLPTESNHALDRISRLITVAQAYQSQQKLNISDRTGALMGGEQIDAYSKTIDRVLSLVKDPTTRDAIRTQLQSTKISDKVPFRKIDHPSAQITTYLTSDQFSQLPAETKAIVEPQLRAELLGYSLGLAQYIKDFPAKDNTADDYVYLRANLLSQNILGPIITSEDMQSGGQPVDLSRLDSLLVDKITNTAGEGKYTLRQSINKNLIDAAYNNGKQVKARAAKIEQDQQVARNAAIALEREIQAKAAAEATKLRQLAVLTALDDPNLDPENDLYSEVVALRQQIQQQTQEIINKYPLTHKPGLFGTNLGAKEGYDQDQIQNLQNELEYLNRLSASDPEAHIKILATQQALAHLQSQPLKK